MDTPGWWDRFHNSFYRNQEWYLESNELLPLIFKLIDTSLWGLATSTPPPVVLLKDDATPVEENNNTMTKNEFRIPFIPLFRILHIGCGTSSLGQSLRTLWSSWYRERYLSSSSGYPADQSNVEEMKKNKNTSSSTIDMFTVPGIEIINIDFSNTCIQYQKEVDPEGIYYTLDAAALPFMHKSITIDNTFPNNEKTEYTLMVNHFSYPFHVVLDKGTIDAVLATRNEITLPIMYKILEESFHSLGTKRNNDDVPPTTTTTTGNNKPQPLIIIISMIGTLQRYLDIEEGIYQYEQKYMKTSITDYSTFYGNSSSSTTIISSSILPTNDNTTSSNSHRNLENSSNDIISTANLTDYCNQPSNKRLHSYSLIRQETGIPPLENPDQVSSYLYIVRPIHS